MTFVRHPEWRVGVGVGGGEGEGGTSDENICMTREGQKNQCSRMVIPIGPPVQREG